MRYWKPDRDEKLIMRRMLKAVAVLGKDKYETENYDLQFVDGAQLKVDSDLSLLIHCLGCEETVHIKDNLIHTDCDYTDTIKALNEVIKRK